MQNAWPQPGRSCPLRYEYFSALQAAQTSTKEVSMLSTFRFLCLCGAAPASHILIQAAQAQTRTLGGRIAKRPKEPRRKDERGKKDDGAGEHDRSGHRDDRPSYIYRLTQGYRCFCRRGILSFFACSFFTTLPTPQDFPRNPRTGDPSPGKSENEERRTKGLTTRKPSRTLTRQPMCRS